MLHHGRTILTNVGSVSLVKKIANQKNLFLKQLFTDLVEIPDEQWSAFEGITEARHYSKEEYFVQLGENSNLTGIVVSGLFRAYYLTQEGKFIVRKFYKSGEIMGPLASAIAKEPAHVTIDAIEESDVVQMRYSDFSRLREQHPCWERLSRILLEANYVRREQRAFQLLAFDATQRYRLFQEEYSEVCRRMSKSDIASYLGISPESLSRIIHRK